MSNAVNTEPDSGGGNGGSGSSIVDSITKWAAVAGTLVALGQAGSTWISGYYDAVSTRIKSDKELQLQTLKDNSELAKTYLDLVFNETTKSDERLIIFSAMKELTGHPLQQWAADRYEKYFAYSAARIRLNAEHAKADQIKDDTERERAQLVSGIAEISEALNNESVVVDEDRLTKLLEDYRVKTARLGEISGNLAVAAVQTEIPFLGTSVPELAEEVASDVSDQIVQLSDRVTAELLYPLFANDAKRQIDANLPYLRNAMKEFRVSDPRVAAVILATIALETPHLNDYEETEAAGASYQGKLGNNQPGDGVKYRGRGYVGLTGKLNYEKLGKLLGLPLVDSPESAKDPQVAMRVTVALITQSDPQLTLALNAADMGAVRKATVGISYEVERFGQLYSKVLSALVDPQKLLVDLEAKDSSARRAARSNLANLGAGNVKSMMMYWDSHSDNYKIRLGISVALSEMVRKNIAIPADVSGALSDEDFRKLAEAAIDTDVTLRINASDVLVALGSPRAVPVAQSLFEAASANGKYNLLLVVLASIGNASMDVRAAMAPVLEGWKSLPGVGSKIKLKIEDIERSLT